MIKYLYFVMIVFVWKLIWIVMLYFILDDDILFVLKVVVFVGIDVCLLMLSKLDKCIVFYVLRLYFLEFLDVGVKIYEYEKGFFYSKIVIVDFDLVLIGIVNMDMRSFYLNFEVNVFLYDIDSI